MIGWKVAKDRPIRSLDVNAWKRNVIDIDKKAASLKEYQSPEDNVYDDNTSMGSIDVDDDSNEGEKQIYNSEPGDQTLQRKKKDEGVDEEDEDDDDYESSYCSSRKDVKETSENESYDDDSLESRSVDSYQKSSSTDGSDGSFKTIDTSSVTNDNDMKPEAKHKTKSNQHNKSNAPDITLNDLFSGDLKQVSKK